MADKAEGEKDQCVVFRVAARDLSPSEKVFFLNVVIQLNHDHPVAIKVASLSVSQMAAIYDMMAADLEIRLWRCDDSLQRLSMVMARDKLYNKLLTSGAPKKMLSRHFARNRRRIELDRTALGVSNANAGRPPAIGLELSYEIAGHWEGLKDDESDYATRISMLHDMYPHLKLASLIKLVEGL